MKAHTTNYFNTFIEVAEDCPLQTAEIPPVKTDKQSVANIQFEMLSRNPYKYNSDEILFHCYATKKELTEGELRAEKELFFSKGQPCFRSSPLTKRYGWGIHCNHDGKIAMFGLGTSEYESFMKDDRVKKVKAMRSNRI